MAILPKSKKPLLSEEEAQLVVAAIQHAESVTSGEVRVYIESHCEYVNAMDRAFEIFDELEMEVTVNRNAVLIYMAMLDRQIAIIGDQGIDKIVKDDHYWHKELAILKSHCKAGKIVEGLVAVVNDIGLKLSEHFPPIGLDAKNEIPDEIVFGH